MTDRRRQIGKRGEDAAALHLEQQGYLLLERNWRRRGGELDIIAADGRVLVFLEVRARTGRRFGTPEESIDFRKQRQVRKLAALYLAEADRGYREFRFDAITVSLHGPSLHVLDIRHLRNAF